MLYDRDKENYSIGYKDGYKNAVKHVRFNIERFIENNRRSLNPIKLVQVLVYKHMLKSLRIIK